MKTSHPKMPSHQTRKLRSRDRENTAYLKTVLHWKKDLTIDLGYKLSKLEGQSEVVEEVWCETCRNFSSDRSSSVGDLMHLSLAFPGVDPQDTYGEPPGTRGEWYIFDNFLRRAGWGHCLVLETNASDPRDAPPGFGRHRSAVHSFQNPG